MAKIISHHQMIPEIDRSVFLAEGVIVIGDVKIGADSSVWPNTILRGDVHYIRIGRRTNIQDLCVGHVTSGTWPLILEDEVTIGHRVILHGCHVKSRCLIGMGSILMDGAVIGEESILGAGSLVTEKMIIPPRTLALGFPAKVKRELKAEEIAFLKISADNYVRNAQSYRNS
ncbi:MAG: gamma carbonic anhydrase family protein [Deltaproteobacteria bacterium]|nr:gamma carbonic anhydrase family protein [Deltaproteobacteria bacterium]MBI4196248.1 gamma carbonic anhydrase family protein [Deltaproteobacteria bacterium]